MPYATPNFWTTTLVVCGLEATCASSDMKRSGSLGTAGVMPSSTLLAWLGLNVTLTSTLAW